MEMTTIHPAESYLRNETNPPSLYVRIARKRRRLFINRDRGVIGIIALGKRTKGYVFTDWASIEQIYYPSQEQDENTDRKLILKYQKLARLATHTNAWLRDIANADLDKSLYENHIMTGTRIDGKCIGLATIEKYCGTTAMRLFREALKNKEKFSTCRFDFGGYDGTLWCEPRQWRYGGRLQQGISELWQRLLLSAYLFFCTSCMMRSWYSVFWLQSPLDCRTLKFSSDSSTVSMRLSSIRAEKTKDLVLR